MLVRVYSEHFVEEAAQIRLKTGEELRADSLQSPDDAEATYRQKRGEGHQGYVTNVTETCHPDNDVQLVVKVQTAPNNTDDAAMLNEAVPNLVERTDVDEAYTDGGYNSADVDETLNENNNVALDDRSNCRPKPADRICAQQSKRPCAHSSIRSATASCPCADDLA